MAVVIPSTRPFENGGRKAYAKTAEANAAATGTKMILSTAKCARERRARAKIMASVHEASIHATPIAAIPSGPRRIAVRAIQTAPLMMVALRGVRTSRSE